MAEVKQDTTQLEEQAALEVGALLAEWFVEEWPGDRRWKGEIKQAGRTLRKMAESWGESGPGRWHK